ncbi:MAG: alpha/beta hydrolase [Phycisphaerae bacterium]|nr:alpha/beta hydrolase [Phycisphaerae bacterium]
MATRRQSLILTVLLAMPVLVVAGLLYVMSGVTDQRAEAERERAAAARVEDARRAAGAAAMGPRVVRPETLEQGVVLIVLDKSGRSNADEPIYFASSLSAWNPRDNRFKLGSRSDMRWQLHLRVPAGTEQVQFKFTRGSWDRCEVSADLSDIENRSLPEVDVSMLQPGEPPRIELAIERWSDERPSAGAVEDPVYGPIKATGTVKRLQVSGGAGSASGATRDVLVWLPPGYEDPAYAGKVYPVLYLMDGQNVFQKHSKIPAEWGADETARGLITGGQCEPFLIVAVPSLGASRMEEYLPAPALEGVTPAGDRFVEWLVTQVKPRVERAFRTDPRPERTAIGGASLGGAIALHAATRRPDIFGLALVESLPLTAGDAAAWKTWQSGLTSWPGRLFLGVGGREFEPDATDRNQALVQAVRDLHAQVTASGVDASRVRLVVGDQDRHDESAWARRLPEALRFLFPSPEGVPGK